MSGVDAEVVATAIEQVEQRMHNVHAQRHPQRRREQNDATPAPKSAALGRCTQPDHLLAVRSRSNRRPLGGVPSRRPRVGLPIHLTSDRLGPEHNPSGIVASRIWKCNRGSGESEPRVDPFAVYGGPMWLLS